MKAIPTRGSFGASTDQPKSIVELQSNLWMPLTIKAVPASTNSEFCKSIDTALLDQEFRLYPSRGNYSEWLPQIGRSMLSLSSNTGNGSSWIKRLSVEVVWLPPIQLVWWLSYPSFFLSPWSPWQFTFNFSLTFLQVESLILPFERIAAWNLMCSTRSSNAPLLVSPTSEAHWNSSSGTPLLRHLAHYWNDHP
jgi:hypothetical protein